MSLVVVVEVSEDEPGFFFELLKSLPPLLEFGASINLNAAKIGQLAWAEPSHIREIGWIVGNGLKAQISMNPFAVSQRQGNAVFSEERKRICCYPFRVAEFYRKTQIERQPLEKFRQCAMFRSKEIGRQLNQHATEF